MSSRLSEASFVIPTERSAWRDLKMRISRQARNDRTFRKLKNRIFRKLKNRTFRKRKNKKNKI